MRNTFVVAMQVALRPYLERTYRQRLSFVDDDQLRLRALQLEWLYHDTAIIDWYNLTCAMHTGEWRRHVCRSPRLVQTGLLLAPSYLMKKLNWFGVWRPQPMPGACGSEKPFEPLFASDNTWIEVLRLGPDFQEGGLYGCWFLAAKGSGVFLNTGRSLRAANRSMLADALGLNLTVSGRKFLHWNPWRLEHNTRLCEHALEQGYSTLQIWWEGCGAVRHGPLPRNVRQNVEACYHEIISCHPKCLALPTPCQPIRQHSNACPRLFCPNCCRSCSTSERERYRRWNETHWPQGPCIHSDMLRTGWNASLACVCDDKQRLLNCLGTGTTPPLELAAPTPAIHWKRDVRSPELKLFLNRTPPCSASTRSIKRFWGIARS